MQGQSSGLQLLKTDPRRSIKLSSFYGKTLSKRLLNPMATIVTNIKCFGSNEYNSFIGLNLTAEHEINDKIEPIKTRHRCC